MRVLQLFEYCHLLLDLTSLVSPRTHHFYGTDFLTTAFLKAFENNSKLPSETDGYRISVCLCMYEGNLYMCVLQTTILNSLGMFCEAFVAFVNVIWHCHCRRWSYTPFGYSPTTIVFAHCWSLHSGVFYTVFTTLNKICNLSSCKWAGCIQYTATAIVVSVTWRTCVLALPPKLQCTYM